MDDITGADLSTAMSEASASPDPATSAPASAVPAQPEGATIAPAGTAPSAPVVQGEPPQDRWPTILENARTEAAQKKAAEYAWLGDVDRARFEKMKALADAATTDLPGFVQQLLNEMAAHPEHSKTLRSMAARTLAGRGAAAPAVDLNPIPVQLDLGNGQVQNVGFYTADQVTAMKAEWLAEARKEFAPAVQTAEELKQERVQAERQRKADEFGTGFYRQLSTLPGFKANEAAIKAKLAAHQFDSDHPAEVKAAALQIYTELVVPTLSATERKAALTEAGANKVNVNTSNPAQPRTTAPPQLKDLSWADGLRALMAANS